MSMSDPLNLQTSPISQTSFLPCTFFTASYSKMALDFYKLASYQLSYVFFNSSGTIGIIETTGTMHHLNAKTQDNVCGAGQGSSTI